MALVNIKPRHRNSGKADAEKRCPPFLQWLRGRECLIGGACAGKIEACHVDFAGDKGTGTKVSDRYSIPMCGGHHAEQHNAGWWTFQARHAIDALAAANEYWKLWPGRVSWENRG